MKKRFKAFRLSISQKYWSFRCWSCLFLYKYLTRKLVERSIKSAIALVESGYALPEYFIVQEDVESNTYGSEYHIR